MKKYLFITILMAISYMGKAQAELNVFEEWTTNSGSQNFFHKCVSQTDGSGNVYIAGATLNGSGDYDILVAKYNSSGVQQWIEQYNGAGNYHDFATALWVDGSSNVYITGTVTDSLLVQGSDIITMKYNSSGTLQWATRYNGTANYYDSGADVVVDGSGNVYITGSIHTSGSYPFTDAVTIKYNSSGTQQWATIYNNTTYNKSETGAKIIFSGATKISIAGAIQTGYNTYSYGRLDYSTSTGAQIGGAILGTGTSNIDYVGDFVQDNALNSYVAGATYDSIGGTGYNYYVMKLDSTLALQWEKTYNGASNLEDMANGLEVDSWGNVYITGYSTSSTQAKNIVTRKYTSSGAVVWTQTYNDTLNGDDAAMAMAMDADGNIYITGYDSTYLGSSSYITIKYDTSGAQQWVARYDGMMHLKDKATNIAVDSMSEIVITGLSETAPGVYEYRTVKYVEKNIVTPTDAMGETASTSFLYYENKGQLISTDSTLIPEVRFYTNSTYPAYYFKNDTMSMVFASIDTIPATNDTLHRIDMYLEYSNSNAKVYPMKEESSYLNYFLGHCPDGVTGIHGNKQLVIPGILDKIDLIYTSNQNGIKYYFVVSPGGDPTKIGLIFNGATNTQLDTTAQELTINSDIGNITFDQPLSYQIDSNNDTITGSLVNIDWLSAGGDKYYFTNFPSYNSGEILIIEVDQGNTAIPIHISNPEWSTFWGGIGYEEGTGVDTDSDGNSYWTGFTSSSSFPTISAPIINYKGNFDAYVVRIGTANRPYPSTTADKLQWVTYYGGANDDRAMGISVIGNGNTGKLFIVGHTNSLDFLTFNNAGQYYQNTIAGGQDAFIVKLNNLDGGVTVLNVWATYFGGSGDEYGYTIKSDAGGNIYIAGTTSTNTYSSDNCAVPTDYGFPQCNTFSSYSNSNAYGGGGTDAFIAKFNSSGQLTWSTFYGGSSRDYINALTIDGSNNLYLTGKTYSNDFPLQTLTGGYNQTAFGGGNYDAFMVKFDNSGTYIWSSYYGGDGDDEALSTVVDVSENFYFSGRTSSLTPACTTSCLCTVPTTGEFPLCNQTGSHFQGTSGLGVFGGGVTDGFFAKFDNAGIFKWGTYYGGNAEDVIYGLDIDNSNNLFFTGRTFTYNSPNLCAYVTSAWYYNNCYNQGVSSGLIGNFNSSNARIWSAHYDNWGTDNAKSSSINVYGNGTDQFYFITGWTTSNNFYTQAFFDPTYCCPNADLWNTYGGSTDAFFVRFSEHDMWMVSNDEIADVNINSDINVYPNPTNSTIAIQMNPSKRKDVFVYLYNSIGEKAYEVCIKEVDNATTHQIDLSKFSDGIYFLQIKTGNENITKKIIKN